MNLAAGGAQTNSTTRSNPGGDARLPTLGGLSGFGLPDMFGSTQDNASFSQFMQNPAVSQMMQSLLSNPQYMNQVVLLYFYNVVCIYYSFQGLLIVCLGVCFCLLVLLKTSHDPDLNMIIQKHTYGCF